MAEKKSTRSAKEIEADLAATRERLSRTVDELAFRVSPQEIKRRQTEQLKHKVNQFAADLQDKATTDKGEPAYDKLALGLGGVSAAALLLGLARRTFHKG